MNKLSIKVQETPGLSINDTGEHEVVIYSISETNSKPSDLWLGTTPQLLFVFKGIVAKGQIKLWIMLEGYKTADDYTEDEMTGKHFKTTPNGTKYEIGADNRRVKCEVKTKRYRTLLNNLAAQTGMQEGITIEPHQLIGKTLVLRIKEGSITHLLNK